MQLGCTCLRKQCSMLLKTDFCHHKGGVLIYSQHRDAGHLDHVISWDDANFPKIYNYGFWVLLTVVSLLTRVRPYSNCSLFFQHARLCCSYWLLCCLSITLC